MIKKLCIFTSSYSPNKQALLDYLEKVFPKDLKVFLFVPNKNREKFRLKKIELVEPLQDNILSFFGLRHFCRKNNIERIVNIGILPYEAFVMAYASWLSKTDFLCYILGNPIDSLQAVSLSQKPRIFFELVFSYFFSIFPKRILLVAKNQEQIAKKYLFFARKKLFYLPATIPTLFFRPQNKLLCRKRLRISPKEKVVIYVGRIGPLKGSDILEELIKRNPDKKFVLIGQVVDGNIDKQGYKNLVLIGSKTHEELIKYYSAADLCIFPSRIEGLPLVPRESMSCGTPALVSDIPATKIFTPALKASLDAQDMDRQLKYFFNLPQKAKENLSRNSREFIIKEFDDDLWKKEYIGLLLN
jgi:glycosyltransferase involved in cell wall biosynthesis